MNFAEFINITKRLWNDIQDPDLIIPIENGYRVFDRYEIRRTLRDTWVVVRDFSSMDCEFHKLIHALTFCILDHFKKMDIAHDVYSLDRQYGNNQFDIKNNLYQLRKYRDIGDNAKSILLTKLNENVQMTKHLKLELKKHVNLAKYLKSNK